MSFIFCPPRMNEWNSIPDFWISENQVYLARLLSEADVTKTLVDARHDALRRYIIDRRKKAELRQVDVAKRLGRYQSYVTSIETGQRRIDVIELIDLAKAIGFDPRDAIAKLMRARG
jgi:hypothetical protein